MTRVKPPLVLALLLAVSLAVTWFFWRQISFARRLDDTELAAVLADDAPPRRAQHGIEEVTRRYSEGRPGMDRWADRLVALSRREEATVRGAAAWAMQFPVDEHRRAHLAETAVEPRLRELIGADADPSVRRNAACSLSLATDPSAAVPVLRSMLEPFTVTAPAAGTVTSAASVGRRPREGETVGRLRVADGVAAEVVTPVPGRVVEVRAAEGAAVAAGAPFVVLAPEAAHALAAAKGLGLAGDASDVERLRTLLGPGAEMPSDVVIQARRAIEAIEARAKK